jgi:hypothetical protein
MREQQSQREKEIARQLSHRGSNKEILSRGNMFSRLNKVCGGNGNAVAAICSKVSGTRRERALAAQTKYYNMLSRTRCAATSRSLSLSQHYCYQAMKLYFYALAKKNFPQQQQKMHTAGKVTNAKNIIRIKHSRRRLFYSSVASPQPRIHFLPPTAGFTKRKVEMFLVLQFFCSHAQIK